MPITRQTVILAAGMGSRLRGGHDVPKPLIEVAGLPLIGHALMHAEASGCCDAIVVTGYQGAAVRAAAETLAGSLSLTFVDAPDPTLPNGHSLAAAEGHTHQRFFLQMVDHVFGRTVLPLLETDELPPAGSRLLVDPRPQGLDLEDATRVRVEAHRITAIGKGVEPWDAIDTGCFSLTPSVFEALRSIPPGQARTVSAAMRSLAATAQLFAVEIGPVRWADVVTPRDRQEAESIGIGRHSLASSQILS